MRDNVKQRTMKAAKYIIETKSTLRQAAEDLNLSRSTIHVDLRKNLPEISPEDYEVIDQILNDHREMKHLMGGEATRQKIKALLKQAG